jgi:hypothetical protein
MSKQSEVSITDDATQNTTHRIVTTVQPQKIILLGG